MDRKILLYLAAYHGGCGHNVIPGDAFCSGGDQKRRSAGFSGVCQRTDGPYSRKYGESDPDGRLCYNEIALPEYVMAREDGERLVNFIGTVHDGVLHWMEDLPGIPDTSSIMGMVRCCVRETEAGAENEIRVMTFARSMTPEYHDEVLREHRLAAEKYGFCDDISEYGVWRYDPANPLIRLMKEACRRVTGERTRGDRRACGSGAFCILRKSGSSVHDQRRCGYHRSAYGSRTCPRGYDTSFCSDHDRGSFHDRNGAVRQIRKKQKLPAETNR